MKKKHCWYKIKRKFCDAREKKVALEVNEMFIALSVKIENFWYERNPETDWVRHTHKHILMWFDGDDDYGILTLSSFLLCLRIYILLLHTKLFVYAKIYPLEPTLSIYYYYIDCDTIDAILSHSIKI